MRCRTRHGILPFLLAALIGALGIVASPFSPFAGADDGHPYTTPGERTYQGRQWRTTCEKYSSTVQRCRAEIMATQVDIVDGQYTFVNRYAFNNLTYLPSPREQWKGNPLATPGTHNIDGRLWQTHCFDEWTGPNGCRSFTMVSVIEANQGASGWTFQVVDKWMFNNVVQFIPPKPVAPPQPAPLWDNPCHAKPPAGYAFTKNGRPHVIKTPYEPNTHYNPISLANFIQSALAAPIVNSSSDPKAVYTEEDKLCMALLGAQHLLTQKQTKTFEGRESNWFPYPFPFDANPGVDDLKPGWYSGLGQAGAMAAFMRLHTYTGDDKWHEVAEKIYESYFVPIEEGGFTNRSNGFVWFEEYPTTPTATVVNNGHFENILALGAWLKANPDPRGQALYDEAIADLKDQLPKSEVVLEGGVMTSYEMIRGYETAPLRAVPAASGARIDSTRLNGGNLNRKDEKLPLGARIDARPNILRNSSLMMNPQTAAPWDWSIVNNNRAGVTFTHDGWVGVHPKGTMWAGIQQTVSAERLRDYGVTPGTRLSLAMNGRLEVTPQQHGTGGKVSVYSDCPGPNGTTVTTLLHENAKNRSRQASFFRSDFIAPAANCGIRIQLLTFSYTVKNTTAWYNNVTLRIADAVGANARPEFRGDNLLVHRRPQSILTVRGQGRVHLEAYADGRWQSFASNVQLSSAGVDVTLPERFTGRNINYNYHDGHVTELQQIACQTGDVYFDNFAKEWAKMSANIAYRIPSPSCHLAEKVLVDHDLQSEPVVIAAVQEEMVDKPEIMPRSVVMPDGSGMTLGQTDAEG